MKRLFLLFLLVRFSISLHSVLLLTSEKTPAKDISLFLSSISGLNEMIANTLKSRDPLTILQASVQTSSQPWYLPGILSEKSVKVILDATNSAIYSKFLSEESIKANLLHVLVNASPSSLPVDGAVTHTISTLPSYKTEAQVLYNLIMKYNWNHAALIHDLNFLNIQIAEHFKQLFTSPMVLVSEEVFNEDSDDEELDERLSSTLKFSGSKIIVVITSAVMASRILRAADKAAIGGSGYVWILSSDAMLYVNEININSNVELPVDTLGILKNGVLGILAEDAQQNVEDPTIVLESVIGIIEQCYLQNSNPSGKDLFDFFINRQISSSSIYQLRFSADGSKLSKYLLYNIRDFTDNYIGYWDDASSSFIMNPDSYILWPGLMTTTPNENIIPLNLAIFYPSDNSEGVQAIKNGAILAMEEINNSPSTLSGFRLYPIFTQTHQMKSLISSNMKLLYKLNVLGYVGPWTYTSSKWYSDYINAHDNPKPLVSYGTSSYLLNSSISYPYFLRTIQPDGLQASVLSVYLQSLSFLDIAVIYQNNDIGNGIYTSLLSNIKSYNINLLNDEKKRAINITYSSENKIDKNTKNNIKAVLDEIVQKQLKVIVYLGDDSINKELLLEIKRHELYGSDYFWIGTMWLTKSFMNSIKNFIQSEQEDIYEALEGSMSLGFRSPVGTLGSQFEENYSKKFNSKYTVYSMLAYDTVYLFARTIQRMVDFGDDYTNGKLLMNYLRSVDISVASGSLKFSENTNDRNIIGYSLLNIQNRELIKIKEYDPLESFIDEPNVTIVWGGGSSNQTIDTWPNVFDCPFPKVMSVTSLHGFTIIICIGIALFVLTVLLSYIYFKCLNHEIIDEISDKVVKTWKDTLVEVTIVIEFFQFIAIAPVLLSLKVVMEVISNLFMLDVMKVTQTDKQYYWVLLSALSILCFIWFVLMVLLIFKGSKWVDRLPLFRKPISLLNELFLPFFGNTMFLPALAMLLDAFVCDRQVLGKAYVYRDCFMTCWEGDHINYAVLSGIAILLYEPLAVICRPIWQQAKTGLNLKTKTFFLCFKTCVQIMLITVGKSLQGNYPVTHGIVFTILVSFFAAATYKFKAFNYTRLDLWEISSLIAIAYMSILSSLSLSMGSNNIGWFVALVLGWACLLLVTFLIQKRYFPTRLFTPNQEKRSGKVRSFYSLDQGGTIEKKSGDEKENLDQTVIVPHNNIEKHNNSEHSVSCDENAENELS